MTKKSNKYFHEYFADYIDLYKKDVVRQVTYQKYLMSLKKLTEIAPKLKMCELDKRSYQEIISKYAEVHAKQTVMDFNTHLKAAIIDAVEEGLIKYNPAKKTIIKGNAQICRGQKFLSIEECTKLVEQMNLGEEINNDYLILLCLKTGLRFSEALGLTPKDFNFTRMELSVNKTYDYKFTNKLINETKTATSHRKIVLDQRLAEQFEKLIYGMEADKPIFVPDGKKIYNTTFGDRLKRLCKQAGIPCISIHGLRHTHASILFYNGVSINSISKRLGHSKISITQNTYLHLIQELEDADNDKIIAGLRCLDVMEVV